MWCFFSAPVIYVRVRDKREVLAGQGPYMGAIYIFRRARLYRKISPPACYGHRPILSCCLPSRISSKPQPAIDPPHPPFHLIHTTPLHLRLPAFKHWRHLSPQSLLQHFIGMCVRTRCVKPGNLRFALKVHILCDMAATYPEIRTTTRYHARWQCIDAIGGTTPLLHSSW